MQVLGSGNFRVSFSHAHPFPAPNVDQPATGTNRADLGYTGRLLLLTSYNPRSFFSGAVRLSAGSVVAPDGYVETGDLLAHAGPSLVTAYPYKLLADEVLDNRTGVSNGSDPEGSYARTAGGWQRVNLGASGTGWTGFDYIHGGQTVTNTFTLDKAALASSNFALDVALLIQYTDPRGSGGATHRLPASSIDVTDFAYRLPYAALDCSKVNFTANLELPAALAGSTTLEVRLRDWDAGADETGDSTVGDESEVDLVQAGASGNPEVVLDAPGILTGLRNMGTPTGTGQSSSPLLYTNQVVNQAGATSGEHFMCLRITDPEFTDTNRGSYHAGVDPTTLIPSASRAVPARTWQIVPITVTSPPVITGVNPTGIVGAVDEFVTFAVTATGSPTSYTWDFSGGGIRTFPVPNTAAVQVQLAGVPLTYTASVTATSASGTSAPFTFSFRVLPPQRAHFLVAPFALPGGVAVGFSDDNLITTINDLPAVFMTRGSSSGSVADLWVAQATSPFPTGPGDWTQYLVAEGVFGSLSVATIDGRLAIAGQSPGISVSSGRYIFATTSTPSGPSDWVATTFRLAETGEIWGQRLALTEYEARPALIASESMMQVIRYFRGLSATPLSESDWSSHSMGANSGDMDIITCLLAEGVRPVVVYCFQASGTVVLRGPLAPEPASSSDWTSRSVGFLDEEIFDVTVLAGTEFETTKLHVITSSSGKLRYLTSQGDTGGTLQLIVNHTLPGASPREATTNGLSLTRLNDRLAVAYTDADGGTAVGRALTVNPLRSDWELGFVNGFFHTRLSIMPYGNALAFAGDAGSGQYGFADGPW